MARTSKPAPRERTDAQRESDKRYEQSFARFNIRIPQTLMNSAKEIALREGTTPTEMVRLLLVAKVAESVGKIIAVAAEKTPKIRS